MPLRKTLARILIKLAKKLHPGNPEVEAMYLKQYNKKIIEPLHVFVSDYYKKQIKTDINWMG